MISLGRSAGIPYNYSRNYTVQSMALVLARSALPILASSLPRGGSGGNAVLAASASELAQHLWAHRSALGGVAKFLFEGFRSQYFPTPPGGKKRKGKGGSSGSHVFLNAGYHGVKTPVYRSLAPVTIGMITHGLGYVNAQSMNFDGQPGMRVTFRTSLAEVIAAISSASPTVFADSMCITDGTGNPLNTISGTNALYLINDYANGLLGRGNSIILHPKALSSRLLSIAQLWCKYKFRHVQINYASMVSSSTNGAIAASLVSTDTADGVIAATTGYTDVMAMPTSGTCSIWQHASLSELNYSGDRWWSNQDENDGTGNLWDDSGGAPPQNDLVQIYLAAQPFGMSLQANATAPGALTRYGIFIVDGVVDFQGVCPRLNDSLLVTSKTEARPKKR